MLTKDGLDDIVLFDIIVPVRRIRYVLVFLPTIGLFVFVPVLNLVLGVFFLILFVELIILR